MDVFIEEESDRGIAAVVSGFSKVWTDDAAGDFVDGSLRVQALGSLCVVLREGASAMSPGNAEQVLCLLKYIQRRLSKVLRKAERDLLMTRLVDKRRVVSSLNKLDQTVSPCVAKISLASAARQLRIRIPVAGVFDLKTKLQASFLRVPPRCSMLVAPIASEVKHSNFNPASLNLPSPPIPCPPAPSPSPLGHQDSLPVTAPIPGGPRASAKTSSYYAASSPRCHHATSKSSSCVTAMVNPPLVPTTRSRCYSTVISPEGIAHHRRTSRLSIVENASSAFDKCSTSSATREGLGVQGTPESFHHRRPSRLSIVANASSAPADRNAFSVLEGGSGSFSTRESGLVDSVSRNGGHLSESPRSTTNLCTFSPPLLSTSPDSVLESIDDVNSSDPSDHGDRFGNKFPQHQLLALELPAVVGPVDDLVAAPVPVRVPLQGRSAQRKLPEDLLADFLNKTGSRWP